MKVFLAALTLVLAGCSTIGSVPNLPNLPAPGRSAAAMGADWSAEFAEGFCSALRQHKTLEPLVQPLLTALKDRDYEAVARHAAEMGKIVRAIDSRLKAVASLYKPARPVMVAWRRSNASWIKSLKEMERAARNSNWTSLERSAVHLAESAVLLDKVSPLLLAFVAERQSMC